MVKILYDEEKCIKCGLCANSRPDVFVLNGDEIQIIKKIENQIGEKIDEKLLKDLKMIEKDCPVDAIKIVE